MAYAVVGTYVERWLRPEYGWPAAAPVPRRRDAGSIEAVAASRKDGGLLRAMKALLAGVRA